MKRFLIYLIVLCLLPSGGIVSAQEQGCEQGVRLASFKSMNNHEFIRIENQLLMDADQIYPIRGINYYPVQTPWRRFLRETNISDLEYEFGLMREAGFNTLRIFLWNAALFQCEGTSNLPVDEAFGNLDAIIQTAGDYDFRLIVTLNDMPDLDKIPLYENPLVVQEQTQFIILRYRNEPTILAWDLRNEGDIDYGSRSLLETKIPRIQVLAWLKETSQLVRELDSNHLITAGWLNEAHSTASYVDFVSFHHWTSAEDLSRRIRALRFATDKPILLQEVGYSTLHANITPQVQAELLESVIQSAADENLLGWMIWTAFDFPITATCYPSPCESPNNAEHYFGIWTWDYTPKPALALIQQYTG